jgi:alpha-D-xyloside xylohydrolase
VVFLLHVVAEQNRQSSGCLVVHDSTNEQDLKIEVYGANGVRVRAVPAGQSFLDNLVSSLVPPADSIASHGPCKSADLESYNMSTSPLINGNLKVEVGADGKMLFTRVSDGKVLITEKQVRQFTPATLTPPMPGFFSLVLEFEAVEGERIYGLGQHKTGKLDNKGVKGLKLNPANTEILVPVVHSSQGFSFLFNLPSFGTVEYGQNISAWHAEAVKQLDMWVATTSDGPVHAESPWAQLQSSYANVTGHAPTYPDWSSGFWQCRNRYHNQTQIMNAAKVEFCSGRMCICVFVFCVPW